MDGRSLFGALVRTTGFGMALFEAMQIVLKLIQLAALAFMASKQPRSGDLVAGAIQQEMLPILISLVLFLVGVLLMRGGDSVSAWAYAPRRSSRTPPAPGQPAAPASKPNPRAKS